MNLFVQIPCLNEEKTLPDVLADIPEKIDGIENIYTLVIDDGSTDNTYRVAKDLGVDFIVQNTKTLGLSKSFSVGIETCLSMGADIIINTDGDNQYNGACIKDLVKPIINGEADIVVGCRNISQHKEFSFAKKILQKIGSYAVGRISRTTIPDTTSGFRAINRKAGIRLFVTNNFSYTLEMLIQAGLTGLNVTWVPVSVNPATRPSRLSKSSAHFIYNQLQIILRSFIFYSPMRFFGLLAGISLFISFLSSLRIAYYLWFAGSEIAKFKGGTGSVLIVSIISAFIFILAGFMGSLISSLRYHIHDLRYHIRCQLFGSQDKFINLTKKQNLKIDSHSE